MLNLVMFSKCKGCLIHVKIMANFIDVTNLI